MPAWLIQILVSFALKFGLAWLVKRFPGLPAEVVAIIEELVKKLTEHKEEKNALIKDAKKKIRECQGIGCPMDLVDRS